METGVFIFSKRLQNANDDDYEMEKPFKEVKNKGGKNKGSDWRQMFLLFLFARGYRMTMMMAMGWKSHLKG